MQTAFRLPLTLRCTTLVLMMQAATRGRTARTQGNLPGRADVIGAPLGLYRKAVSVSSEPWNCQPDRGESVTRSKVGTLRKPVPTFVPDRLFPRIKPIP